MFSPLQRNIRELQTIYASDYHFCPSFQNDVHWTEDRQTATIPNSPIHPGSPPSIESLKSPGGKCTLGKSELNRAHTDISEAQGKVEFCAVTKFFLSDFLPIIG